MKPETAPLAAAEIYREDRPRVGITMGDVNGIGPELAIKLVTDTRILKVCIPVLFGSGKALHYYKKLLEIEKLTYQQVDHPNDIHRARINFVECSPEFGKVEAGTPSEEAGLAAFQALELAIKYIKQGHVDCLLTLPIDKLTIQREGFSFPGHTEYLGAQFGAKETLMLMVHEQLRVAVVTGHIPLREVASAITQEKIVSKLVLLAQSLQVDFNLRKPKLAVLGLNPHAGDGGLIGGEDQDILAPAIAQAQKQGLLVFGPFPADGFFAMGQYRQFDGILAMYHDQGLIPFKALAEGLGVNFTAGLPIIRTSPDHGTAYDIAGHNKADETSSRNALYVAVDAHRTRKENKTLLQGALGKVDLPDHLKHQVDEVLEEA
jgi:4-hydroxythreonine-4-phosphate dehydrogenase